MIEMQDHNTTLGKCKTALLFVFMVLSLVKVRAQKETGSKKFSALKTDLTYIGYNFFGVVNSAALTFEKGFSSQHSVQFTPIYLKYIHIKTNSLALVPEYKYYFNKQKNFSGFFSGAYLKYRWDHTRTVLEKNVLGERSLTETEQGYGGGIIAGFQTYIHKHYTVEIIVGLGAIHRTQQVKASPGLVYYETKSHYPYTGADGRFAFNLGYRF